MNVIFRKKKSAECIQVTEDFVGAEATLGNFINNAAALAS